MFAIAYDHPTAGRMWYGRGRHPHTRSVQAITFATRREAELRLEDLRRVFACGPDLDERLIDNAKIVELPDAAVSARR